MYTLEIAGDPIAITNGAEHEAIRLFNREEFRSELIVLGIVRERSSSEAETKFVVRQSFRKEELVFERDFARASALGEIVRANETGYLAFLVQVGGMLG